MDATINTTMLTRRTLLTLVSELHVPIAADNVASEADNAYGMRRVAVVCKSAAHILVMCSMMARIRRASATA